MLRCGRSLANAGLWALLVVLAGCSESERSKPSYIGRDGGNPGAGAGGDFGNPELDGGPLLVGDGGLVCPPDSDDCMQPAKDGGTPPAMDGGAPPNDSGEPPIEEPDAEVPEPDADVPDDAGELDSGVVIPPEDGGDGPTAATYKIDLLFVVDNSGSMREEQLALREQFPMLISRLLSNTAIGGGEGVVAGAQDIHLGVVSTDLGAVGASGIEGCTGLGDEGLLNNFAGVEATGCSTTVFAPRFLSYVAGTDDATQLATDLGCIADLGITGCGFEQQLESMLKAVWPGDDGRITFLTDLGGFGMTGQAGAAFPNGEFVRHGGDDVSVLAIVLVSDEEDCSSSNTSHLFPAHQLPIDDPRSLQGLNTRCFYESQQPEPNGLYDIERYVDGLRSLRPGYEQRVVFGAIVGVPAELVSPSALSGVDFSSSAERSAHYSAILSHPDMQYQLDDRGTPEVPEDDGLRPSCTTATGSALAYAPRRIVEVARGFGEHGFVQSICASDWSPAMELLATRIAQARSE
jgi:hypothetical protein